MKRLRRLGIVLAAIVLSSSFAGCDDDDGAPLPLGDGGLAGVDGGRVDGGRVDGGDASVLDAAKD